jgi:GT2 family glycosyltransferase
MHSRGYSIMVVPQSVVYHLGGGALGYESPRKTYLNFRNNLLMLYKNLSTPRLQLILFLRFFLDYVAALQMLLTGKVLNAKEVVRARLDFIKMRRLVKNKRRENIRKSTTPYPSIIARRSILFDYYLRGKRN